MPIIYLLNKGFWGIALDFVECRNQRRFSWP